MLRRVVWGNCTATTFIIIIIIRVYDGGRSRTLCKVGRHVPDNTLLFFFIETVMSMKWNFIEVAYTNYDWRGSFQVSIHDIIKEVFHEPCTYSYIYTPRICLESCVYAEETLHIWGLSQNCHITQQNTLFIGRAGVIVLFEGPRAWKQWLRRLYMEIYWQEMKYWKHSGGHNFWPIRREMGKTNNPNTTTVPGCVYLFCLKNYWFAARPVTICAKICVYLYSTAKDNTVRLQ